ncbi:MAG: hypothetical protein JXB88_11370 [Spirochaetales bacterium]|nr:hypothetical protein [Spirochaetales bacterium]
MKNVILSLVILVCASTLLFSQQQPQNTLELKIKDLEDKVDKLKDQLAFYTKFYEEQKGLIDRYNIILIALIILGGLSEFFILKTKLTAETEKRIEEGILNIIKKKKEFLIKILKAEEYEEKIKADKKILVLSNKKRVFEKELREFFTKYKFRSPDFKYIDDKVNYNKYDLILLNKQDDKITINQINSIIDKVKNKAFFCLSSEQMNPRPIARYINFANNLITLYPRLLELLQYRDTMEEEYI